MGSMSHVNVGLPGSAGAPAPASSTTSVALLAVADANLEWRACGRNYDYPPSRVPSGPQSSHGVQRLLQVRLACALLPRHSGLCAVRGVTMLFAAAATKIMFLALSCASFVI